MPGDDGETGAGLTRALIASTTPPRGPGFRPLFSSCDLTISTQACPCKLYSQSGPVPYTPGLCRKRAFTWRHLEEAVGHALLLRLSVLEFWRKNPFSFWSHFVTQGCCWACLSSKDVRAPSLCPLLSWQLSQFPEHLCLRLTMLSPSLPLHSLEIDFTLDSLHLAYASLPFSRGQHATEFTQNL